jgi:hypothetical protein
VEAQPGLHLILGQGFTLETVVVVPHVNCAARASTSMSSAAAVGSGPASRPQMTVAVLVGFCVIMVFVTNPKPIVSAGSPRFPQMTVAVFGGFCVINVLVRKPRPTVGAGSPRFPQVMVAVGGKTVISSVGAGGAGGSSKGGSSSSSCRLPQIMVAVGLGGFGKTRVLVGKPRPIVFAGSSRFPHDIVAVGGLRVISLVLVGKGKGGKSGSSVGSGSSS